MTPSELRAWRLKHRFSRRTLAEKLGVTRGAIDWWESGQRRIPGMLPLALRSLHQRALDTAKHRRKRVLKRVRDESLRLAPPVAGKFW